MLTLPLSVIFMSLWFMAGCSDDETTPDPEPESVYTLSLGVNSEEAGSVTGAGEYEEGDLVSIAATPSDGWMFVEWSGDVEFIADDASPQTEVTMPASDVNLTATFMEEAEPEPFTVIDIDGNVYRTIILGEQEWMAENLRVTRYNNGDAIPTDLSNTDWVEATQGAYAIYANNEEMVEHYGKLYNWFAVDDARGLCPEGWSVPGDDDWSQMVDYVVDQGFENHAHMANSAANALKSCRQIGSPLGGDCDTTEHPRWGSEDTHHGFDEFAFSALPGGSRWSDGVYRNIGQIGFWWTSDEITTTHALQRNMARYFGHVVQFNGVKTLGFSVRCVRPAEE